MAAFGVREPAGDGLGDDEAGGELVLADGDGDGELDDGLGEALAKPVWLLAGAGDDEAGADRALPDGLACGRAGLLVLAGWLPTRLPTVVPDALWFQTTVCSGLPAATSTTLTAPITPTKTTALAAASLSHIGQPSTAARHRASQPAGGAAAG